MVWSVCVWQCVAVSGYLDVSVSGRACVWDVCGAACLLSVYVRVWCMCARSMFACVRAERVCGKRERETMKEDEMPQPQ